jgi:SNF2 family DNA or RNA helicase
VQIVENKALLLNVRDPNRITEVIPRSKVLDSGQVLVKWGLEEAQVLKNLRIKNVPSPIKNRYEWTGLYKPFDHQKETSSFLTLHRRAFCFNEQGTGKTSSVIWAADYLIKEKFINRVLVICPLSIMQSAWEADLFKFAMHRTCAIAHSYSKEKRIQAIHSDTDFVIINYDGLEIIKDEIINAKFDLIVVDEANAYKNVHTKRWKILASVIRPETWVWMLTGTPASQSPTDAYGLAKIINPTGVPKFFGAFRDMVLQKITQFKWIPKPSSERVVHQVLQPAIRYTKEECLDLPDMTYVTREVPLSTQQNKFYEAIRNNMMTVAAGEEITTVNAAVNLNKLLQLSCGAVYSDSGEIVTFDAKNRMTALLEVIEEASHKVMQKLFMVAYPQQSAPKFFLGSRPRTIRRCLSFNLKPPRMVSHCMPQT